MSAGPSGSSSHRVDHAGQVVPVRAERGELLAAGVGEGEVLAGWAGRRLAPLVLDEAVSTQLAQQWIQRALLGRKAGRQECGEDLRRVPLPELDGGQHEWLE